MYILVLVTRSYLSFIIIILGSLVPPTAEYSPPLFSSVLPWSLPDAPLLTPWRPPGDPLVTPCWLPIFAYY